MADHEARGGTLILGGGFAGSYVARYLGKRGATIVSPENYMLYTPMLPEAASGTLEPRHVVVPTPADVPARRAAARRGHRPTTPSGRRVQVQAGERVFWVRYSNLVVALGAIVRSLPIPGLAEHALGFKSLADAIHLRNHVLGRLEVAAADPNPTHRRRELTFVFVGAGYAGVEALAELSDLVRDALRYYPELRDTPQQWVLVDAAPKILPEIPTRLGDYAARLLARRGVDIRTETTLEEVEPHAARLSDGDEILTSTVVWTAGVRAHPILAEFGLPTEERGRVTRRRDPAGTRRPTDLGARRLRRRAEPRDAWPVRPADVPARPPAGAPPGEEPRGRGSPVPVQDARRGGDTRPPQGDRERPRHSPPRLPRLVGDPDLSPVPAAAPVAEAARRGRLDGGAVLPPRHRASSAGSAIRERVGDG